MPSRRAATDLQQDRRIRSWDGERERPATVDQAMEQKRLAHNRAKEVYRLFGKEECLGILEFEGGHAFRPEGRQEQRGQYHGMSL